MVWFERYSTAATAIAREKQIKNWSRQKKLKIIDQENPTWLDLSKA
ncbi:MAG TPA: hypothetical protein VGM27_33400 [Acidobacteriaceae bacterium]